VKIREGTSHQDSRENAKAGVWMSLSRTVEETDQADIIR
jgi:hypothetical protein